MGSTNIDDPETPASTGDEPPGGQVRPRCASVNGTWDQVQDPDTGEWYCPPDPHVPQMGGRE